MKLNDVRRFHLPRVDSWVLGRASEDHHGDELDHLIHSAEFLWNSWWSEQKEMALLQYTGETKVKLYQNYNIVGAHKVLLS